MVVQSDNGRNKYSSKSIKCKQIGRLIMEHKRRKTDNQHNGKVTIREVYDIILPMRDDITTMKGDVGNMKDDVEELKICIKGKISIRAFATWLSVTTGILLLVFIILGFYYRGG